MVYQCLFACLFVHLLELLQFGCEQRMSEKAKDMLIAYCKPVAGHESASVCFGLSTGDLVLFHLCLVKHLAEEPTTGVVSIDESPL